MTVIEYMPKELSFTEEELDEESRQSEASGYITREEASAKFAEWGFER